MDVPVRDRNTENRDCQNAICRATVVLYGQTTLLALELIRSTQEFVSVYVA